MKTYKDAIIEAYNSNRCKYICVSDTCSAIRDGGCSCSYDIKDGRCPEAKLLPREEAYNFAKGFKTKW